jgi:hypothetical protein
MKDMLRVIHLDLVIEGVVQGNIIYIKLIQLFLEVNGV